MAQGLVWNQARYILVKQHSFSNLNKVQLYFGSHRLTDSSLIKSLHLSCNQIYCIYTYDFSCVKNTLFHDILADYEDVLHIKYHDGKISYRQESI